jgi:3-demethylubiquinone-9 3-methyltransferase
MDNTIHMQKIAPCLWFDDKAEEAAKFYVSIFKNSEGDADGQFDLPYGVLHLLHGAYC